MGLNKYKGFVGGDPLPAENVNSIDPDNITPQTKGYLTGGASSALSVFQALGAGANNGKIKINIDGSIYDNVGLDLIATSWAISGITSEKTKAITPASTPFGGLAFSQDGAKMYTVVSSTIYQYSLSTPWDIATLTSEKTKVVQSGLSGIHFNPTGTKMFILCGANIYQYTLSTAWDIATATYDTKTYSVSAQLSTSYTIRFKSDGLKFIVGSSNNTYYQYNLSTAWDITTASYASKSFNIGGSWLALNFDISPDGTKFFAHRAYGTHYIYQYNLSTPWDITTATESVSFTAPSQTGGVFFRPDGAKCYIVAPSTAYQYATGTTVATNEAIATNLQTAIRAATGKTETVVFSTDKFIITSSYAGSNSKVLKLMTPSTGTDISGAGATPYLNCAANATETLGTGEDYNLARLGADGKLPAGMVNSGAIITLIPNSVLPLNPTATSHVAGGSLGNSTTAFVGQVLIPFKITVNKLSHRLSISQAGSNFKFAIYSQDGQIKYFEAIVPATAAAVATVTVSPAITLEAGIYYVAVCSDQASPSHQPTVWATYEDADAYKLLPGSVTGKAKIEGSLTITANTLPATFDPSSLAYSGGNRTPYIRLDT